MLAVRGSRTLVRNPPKRPLDVFGGEVVSTVVEGGGLVFGAVTAGLRRVPGDSAGPDDATDNVASFSASQDGP
jgi:hypothetical protein